MGNLGPMGAFLQDKVDAQHSNDLQNHSQNIAQINQELRHILQPLKADFTKILHDPKQEGPYDLSEFVGKFDELGELYNQFMATSNSEEIPPLFSGDLAEVSHQDLEKILRKIDDIETDHKDSVQNTTQKLYLIGQLFITVTDILRKMDEGQRRAMERIAEKTGMR